MTTQTVHIHTYDYGASLTSATLRAIDTDALVATADATGEVTADSGLYAVVFGQINVPSTLITAGTYRLRAIAGGQPINRYVTLVGVDAEVAQSRSERFAELPPNGITAAVLATDSITAAALAAGAVNEIQSGLATQTSVDAIQSDTDNIQTRLPAALESGRMAAALDSASIDAIWNEVLTGATHNIASSAGRRLRQLADTVVLVDGVCDAASNAGTDSTGTITLEVGTTTACVGQAIRCENQVRFIALYNAGTRVAQLDRPWCVVPDAGDEYVIFNVRNPLIGLSSLALAGSTAAAVNDVNAVTDKIDTGLVLDGAVYQFTENMLELGPSGGGGGGDATLAKQEEILAALQGVEAIQVASPNVQGNLVLTQGDDYDGVANPRAQWNVTTDYTTGWTVRLTIRDKDDAVIYTNTGSVVSATVVAVTIAAPTGLEMTGCPGQWQGKFDVELTHSSGKKKTIALGVCYINEDQTR